MVRKTVGRNPDRRRFGRVLAASLHTVLRLFAPAFAAILLAAALHAPVAHAQDPAQGPGAQFRMGHIEGQGIPQYRPITPIELFPYWLLDEQLLFSDVRFFPTNDGLFGGNLGLGYRYYESDWDTLFGISGWYDADGTRDLYFQQTGLSLEAYTAYFDFRTNLYLPVGDTTQESFTSLVGGSLRFSGDNIVYNQMRGWYAAMKGLDMEIGTLLPGDFAENGNLRAYGGFYHYEDDDGNTITGGSARLTGNLIAGLDASLQITHDSFFQTRAFAGVSWTFGALHASRMDQSTSYGRIGEHVTRNYTVLAPERKQIDQMTAINPATGLPYRVSHVSSNAGGGGNGNVGNPYQSIAAAQAAGRDIIFVHAGSVFNGADANIVMNPGERIFGDGANVYNLIDVRNLGTVLMPRGPTGGDRPILNGSIGNAVVLASNSEFGGFSIVNPAGYGILGDGVHDVTVRGIQVNGAGLDGVRLLNSGGTIRFNDAVVQNSAGSGVFIDGGAANISWDGRIGAGTGRQVVVANTTGGLVDFTGTSFDGSGGTGILLSNDAGNVTFKSLMLSNSLGNGIDIQGGSGQFEFQGVTTVNGAAGTSIAINSLAGKAKFDDIVIDNRHDRGILVDGSAGSVEVTGRTAISNQLGSTQSAIQVSNSSGSYSFNRVEVVDATGAPGVAVQDNTGTTRFETLNIKSNGGTALYANNGGLLQINPTHPDRSVDINEGGVIEAVNGTALDLQSTTLDVNLNSVSASNAVNGIRMMNTAGELAVYGTGSEGSGGRITNTTTAVLLQNTGATAFQWLTLDSNNTGIRSNNVTFLIVENSVIKNSTTYGIDAINTTKFTMGGSSLTNNGTANMRALFDTQRAYTYTIDDTEFKSNAANNVILTAQGGGVGSTMNLVVRDSYFENTLASTSALQVDWNGTLTGTVDYATILTSGGSNTGILVTNANTTALTNFTVTHTAFSATGGNDTFTNFIIAGTAQANVSNNLVEFEATNGTGIRMSLGKHSSATVSRNNIYDDADGATGILFDSLAGPTNVSIESNVIDMADLGALLDRGIIFNSIDTTDGKVTLIKGNDNQVFRADTSFFVPVGTTTGSILVNGVQVP